MALTSTEKYTSSNATATLIKTYIESYLMKLNTMVPAVVEEYSKERNRVVVKPAFKITLKSNIRREDGVVSNEIDTPPLKNVPVLYFGGDQMRLSFDIKKGDRGIILFSQRSLEQWKKYLLNNIQPPPQHAPKVKRKFNISDGMFLPCILDTGQQDIPGIGTVSGLLGGLTGGLGGLIGGLVDKPTLGGNQFKWKGKLDMGNDTNSLKEILTSINESLIEATTVAGLIPVAVALAKNKVKINSLLK